MEYKDQTKNFICLTARKRWDPLPKALATLLLLSFTHYEILHMDIASEFFSEKQELQREITHRLHSPL